MKKEIKKTELNKEQLKKVSAGEEWSAANTFASILSTAIPGKLNTNNKKDSK